MGEKLGFEFEGAVNYICATCLKEKVDQDSEDEAMGTRSEEEEEEEEEKEEPPHPKRSTYTDTLFIRSRVPETELHVGDIIVYNHKLYTAGTLQARTYDTIVEFHRNNSVNPMELATGYLMEQDHIVMLCRRKDGSLPTSSERIVKELSLFILSYEDARWKGETLQDRIAKKAQEAQLAIEELMENYFAGELATLLEFSK